MDLDPELDPDQELDPDKDPKWPGKADPDKKIIVSDTKKLLCSINIIPITPGFATKRSASERCQVLVIIKPNKTIDVSEEKKPVYSGVLFAGL